MVTAAIPTRILRAVGQRLDLPRMIVAYDVARQAFDTLAKMTEEPEEISLDDDTLDPIAVDEEDDDAQEDQNIDMMEGQSDATDSDIWCGGSSAYHVIPLWQWLAVLSKRRPYNHGKRVPNMAYFGPFGQEPSDNKARNRSNSIRRRKRQQ